VRKQRVISAQGAGVTSVILPTTGERILIHAITGSFTANGIIVAARTITLVKTWAGATVDQVFLAGGTVADTVNMVFQFAPGLQAQSEVLSGSTQSCQAPLPEDDGLIVELGDEVQIVIFGADGTDVIGAIGMVYSVLAKPGASKGG